MSRALVLRFFGRAMLALLLGGSGWGAAAPPVPVLAIPRMTAPPTLDGHVDPQEWQEAVAVSGVEEQGGKCLVMRPTTFLLAWDPGHLYVACRTWLMPGCTPPVWGRVPGAAGCGDVSLELHFKPVGRLVAGQTDSSFKFNVNALGFYGDCVRVSVGQLFRTWSPKFQVAMHQSAPGTAPKGGSWLEWEMAATPRDFELASANRAGDQWLMMLGFDQLPGWTQARIPANSGYFDPSGYPLATLVEQTVAAQVTMDDLPGVSDGVAAARFAVYNPTARPAPVELAFETQDAQGELVCRQQALTVAARQRAEWVVNEPFPRATKGGTLSYRVTAGGRTLCSSGTAFTVGYPESWVKVPPATVGFPLWATFNPVRCNFQIVGDAYALPNRDQAQSLHYRITREGDAQPLLAHTITGMEICQLKLYDQLPPRHLAGQDRIPTYYFKEFAQLPALGEGTYRVEAAIVMADGQRIGPVTTTFKKLNEARGFAAWWGKGIGNCEQVIPPFVPMTASKDLVTAWGRRYRLNVLGLPNGVVSQEQELMAGPVRIVAVVDGKPVTIPLAGAPRLTEIKDWRIGFAGEVQGAGLAFRSQGWVEQDGVARVELTYAPAGTQPVKLDALALEFPLADTTAECLVCVGPGGNFSTRTNIVLPARKGQLWSTLELGKVASLMNVGTFFPQVWLGNERRGLLWWGDSDRGWVPHDAVPAHDVRREGRAVILRNNLVGQSLLLAAPRTVAFGYAASPFRPLPKGWRAGAVTYDGTFSGGPEWGGIGYKSRKDPKTGAVFDGWSLLSPPSADPNEWSAIWAQYKQRADAQVHSLLPYNPTGARNGMFVHTSVPLIGYGARSSDSAVNGYFSPEWADNTCYPESNSDYLTYLIQRGITEGGLRTIYWDVNYPSPVQSVQNDTAYFLPDGRIQPGYPGFNLRRFLMRSYALLGQYGLNPGAQVSHVTNAYVLVDWPWLDSVLEGEFHKLTDSSTMDWVDGYPIERMRAMSTVHNFGVPFSWMDHIQIADPKKLAVVRRGMVDYLHLYDSWQGPSLGGFPGPLLEWGLNDAAIGYVPFWRNPYVKVRDPNLLVSMWRLPDRVLLVIFNYDRSQTKSASVTLDLAALGLSRDRNWPGIVTAHEMLQAKDPGVGFDRTAQRLMVPGLAPRTARTVALSFFERDDLDRLRQQLGGVMAGGGTPLDATQVRLSPLILDWGLPSARTTFRPVGQTPEVTCTDPDLRIALWQQPDRVMLAIRNANDKQPKDALLKADLKALNLVPQPWQEFIGARALDDPPGPAPALDFYQQTVKVPAIPPQGTRLVGLRRY